MSNLEIWNRLAQPPKEFLKNIVGGRLKGMTDINPQWRLQALTNEFGPVGVGWKYEIKRAWTEPGAGDEVFVFVEVALYVKRGEVWSDPIPGMGGNMLVEKETRGFHNNDEGYKMALTDAIGVASKALGVGADVYMRRWDGKEFSEPLDSPKSNDPKQTFGTKPEAPKPPLRPKQTPPPPVRPKQPAKPSPKPETWQDMSDQRRIEYTCGAVQRALEIPDPTQSREALEKIRTSPNLNALSPDGMTIVTNAILDAIQQLDQEAADAAAAQ